MFDEANSPARFRRAVVAFAVVGRAVESSDVSGIPVRPIVRGISVRIVADENFKVSAAAAVYPDAARLMSPGAAFDAFRFAMTF